MIKKELTRRSLILTGAAAAATLATPTIALARQPERRLRFHCVNTGENYDRVFFDGRRYVKDAIEEFNWFARDWRRRRDCDMDKSVMNTAWALQSQIRSDQTMHLISAYRTPQTNRSLRGTAKNSLHMRGMALDIRQPGLASSKLYRLAWNLQRGGVGKYTRSNFVHIDSGNVRTWGS